MVSQGCPSGGINGVPRVAFRENEVSRGWLSEGIRCPRGCPGRSKGSPEGVLGGVKGVPRVSQGGVPPYSGLPAGWDSSLSWTSRGLMDQA